MRPALLRVFTLAAAVAVLAGCGSSGGGPDVIAIADDEAYRGPLAAAVSPVQFAGASATDRNWLQREIVRVLGDSDAFATVIPLSARGERNEAEVLIDPSVVRVERYSGGLDRIDLRLRARRKSTGAVGLDQVYRGKRRGQRSAIIDAADSAAKDLSREYGERPVY
ncbi:hypothetical protein CKO31_12425 [Thiohalocapsa halophila]|uniref:Penicillin-binding protein activator LpoB n=1 Tax=Thiohalocapsa halophila TaxID=69359 RepID=A0ABS1CI00_9GAMM|nr:hypothetical protein [Thiohalocapsa halophila]MBK1631534.1 hypothetical protein [Thiohalocapsa halophila]